MESKPDEFLPQEIIRKKRDGITLSDAELRWMVDALHRERIGEGQVAAFAMAVFFRGMSRAECASLTRAMMESGDVLDWSGHSFNGPVVDKHSTGGVGDKVSLMLAPILAACGAIVPMISGRGLGHTGGTLDKLESIPGYGVSPSNEQFARVLHHVGCAIIGQTAALAPADRRFYAIRDVTATVESIPLITASILSKKLAAGLERLVLDVKVGSGAFIPQSEPAFELARSLVGVATQAGLGCSALLTDMNEVLGSTAGNAIEVREAIEYLVGTHRETRLHEVTVALAVEVLQATGLGSTPDEAKTMVERALHDGRAAECFAAMVRALGGPADLLSRYHEYLPVADVELAVTAPGSGFIHAIDVRRVGMAIVAMGGGRTRTGDSIDPRVGLSQVQGRGARVGPDQPLAIVHATSSPQAEQCAQAILDATQLSDTAPGPSPVIVAQISET